MQIVLPDLEYARQRDTAGYPVATTCYHLVYVQYGRERARKKKDIGIKEKKGREMQIVLPDLEYTRKEILLDIRKLRLVTL